MSHLKHPDHVEGWSGSLKELAENIAKMRYDTASEFLSLLSEEYEKQSSSDNRAGRKQLSVVLFSVSALLESTKNSLQKAWKISKPYMSN